MKGEGTELIPASLLECAPSQPAGSAWPKSYTPAVQLLFHQSKFPASLLTPRADILIILLILLMRQQRHKYSGEMLELVHT